MKQKRRVIRGCALLVVMAWGGPGTAFQSPATGTPVAQAEPARSSRPAPLPAPVRLLAPSDSRARALAAAAGGRWTVSVDAVAGTLRRAVGPGIDLGEKPASEASVRRWLTRHADLVGSDLAGYVLDSGGSRPIGDGAMVPFLFQRMVNGVPVENAQLLVVVRDTRVVYLGAAGLGPIAVATAPALDDVASWAAAAAAASAHGLDVTGALPVDRSKLVIVADPAAAGRHRMVRRHRFRLASGFETWQAEVDVQSGELLALEDTNRYACAPDPSLLSAPVRGGIRPDQATDPEQVRGFPVVRVTEDLMDKVTDAGGFYRYGGGLASSALDGPHFKVTCDGCNLQPYVENTIDGVLDFGTGGFDQTSNGWSTPADRSALYSASQARQLFSDWRSLSWFGAVVGLNTNILLCNAFWDGTTLHLGTSSPGRCRNFGEVRDIVVHEWSHGLDDHDGIPPGDRALGEAYGDMMALLVDRDSCIGESAIPVTGGTSYCLSLPGCPTTALCDGTRNMDELRAGVGVLSVATAPTSCPPANGCRGPLGYECHCEGQIASQALFHTLMNLATGTDYATGAPLPGRVPALSTTQSWLALERMFLMGSAVFASYLPSNLQSLGTSLYDGMLLADDDDANLANGTPHSTYLNAAFTHHGIAETPLIPDAAACVAPATPGVATAIGFDPQSGRAEVAIQWNGVPAATAYRVLRASDLDDAAFLAVPPVVDTGSPLYEIHDTDVDVGRTYFYRVVALSASGCASSGDPVSTVAVALPDVVASVGLVLDTAPGGDGDGEPEPGEQVEVRVDLGEVAGLADLVNATVTLASRTPLATVTVPGPIAYGTVPALGTVPGPSNFAVALSVTYPCGSTVPLVATIAADNGCMLRALALEVPANCNVMPRGEVDVDSIRIARDGGACSDGDGRPDNGEQVEVEVTVRNVGTLPVSAATALLDTSSASVAIGAPTLVSIGSLAPGAVATASFAIYPSGAACQEEALLIAVADSPENVSPRQRETVVVLEEDRFPAALDVDFETGFGSWTAVGFVASTLRAQSGMTAAFAGPLPAPHPCDGSADGANACATLTSAPFVASATSELRLSTWYTFEPYAGQYWDRANVHVIAGGVHTPLAPTAGRPYDGGAGEPALLCHIDAEAGWAGDGGKSWAPSVFSLGSWKGQEIAIEVSYNTDFIGICEGFYVDDIAVTDAEQRACDATSCASTVNDLKVSQRGDDLLLSWQKEPGSTGGYRVYRAETDKTLIPMLRGSGAGGSIRLVAATAPSSDETSAEDFGAAGVTAPELLFYQVVGVGRNGSEGPN